MLSSVVAVIPEVGVMQREVRKKKRLNAKAHCAGWDMPGLDSHLCFALLRRQQIT